MMEFVVYPRPDDRSDGVYSLSFAQILRDFIILNLQAKFLVCRFSFAPIQRDLSILNQQTKFIVYPRPDDRSDGVYRFAAILKDFI
jgi:hypothetical protein